MGVKFQSDEWAKQMTETMQSNDAVANAAKGQSVAVQIVTTETPEGGENKFYFKIAEGVPEIGMGEIENPEATITQTYETAKAIDKRELNTQAAFMQGKLKINGNIMKLMQLQGFLQAVGTATESLEREY